MWVAGTDSHSDAAAEFGDRVIGCSYLRFVETPKDVP
jgi:hypothetical protein